MSHPCSFLSITAGYFTLEFPSLYETEDWSLTLVTALFMSTLLSYLLLLHLHLLPVLVVPSPVLLHG
jgi:hypothetical protein